MLLEELLMEELNVNGALSIFGLTFKEFSAMSSEDLKKRWREFVKKSHPDLPENRGQGDKIANINAAYDFLKNYHNKQSKAVTNDPSTPQPFRRSAEPYPKPDWQPDETGNNKIYVETYRDKNFIKKHIWEMSDKSKELWRMDAYENNMFGGRINVFGSQAVFGEMSRAMRIYHSNGGKENINTTIFVSTPDKPKTIYMIYTNGIDLSKRPIPLEYTGESQYTDYNFKDKLPEIIQQVTNLYRRNGRE